jgi:hypothetical protein
MPEKAAKVTESKVVVVVVAAAVAVVAARAWLWTMLTLQVAEGFGENKIK